MPVSAVSTLERFFRETAGLDVDKLDLRRFGVLLNARLASMLTRGLEVARENQRDIVEAYDLPVTEGLRERIIEFRKLDHELKLRPMLAGIIAIPQIGVTYSTAAEEQLPEIAGGLAVAMAKSFPVLDPNVKNPQTAQWERLERLFTLLL
jgi:hypothetical protein